MMKKIHLSLLMLLIGVWAMALDTSVKNADGVEIWYELDSNTKTARVTSGSEKYTGEVVIPSTVTYEGVEYSVTEIRGGAFSDCSSLTGITISKGVKSIGKGAFRRCSALTSVTIPDGVTSIGEAAFHGTAIYNDVSNWENGVLYIDNCLIEAKSDINGDYTVKDGARVIATVAFYGCSSLTSLTIPASVTSIDEGAFYGCSSLTSVTIPEGVTSIGGDAFYDCSGLANIEVSSDNVAYTTVDGVLFSKDKTELVCYPTGKSATSYIIPESVTEIGESAFAYCSSLTSVTIPESVAEIGEGAFDHSGLISVTIHKGVMSIGRYAFTDCSALTNVTIPESMTEIVDGLFCDCSSLTSVTIPKGVTSIGSDAFYKCSGLTSITSKNTTPPTVEGNWTFEGVNKSIPLYVPAESVEAYKSTEGWNKFTNILPIQADGNPISDVNVDNISVRPIGNNIVVTGTDNYTVYSISGQSLGKVTSVERGIYIVVAEGKSYKVAIK